MPRNFALEALALVALLALIGPSLTLITTIAHFAAPYLHVPQHIARTRRWRTISSSTFRPRKVLVTGVGTPIGLSLARTFYRAGHIVVGADVDRYSPSRLSKSLEIYYTVERGSEAYERDVIDLCRKEKIELWVPCGQNSLLDAKVKSSVQKATKCQVVGLDTGAIEILEGQGILETAKAAGLQTPEMTLVVSEKDALNALYSQENAPDSTKRFTLRPVGESESRLDENTFLPLSTVSASEDYVCSKLPSPSNPFLLQQYITGAKFQCHILAIRGRLKTFATMPVASSGTLSSSSSFKILSPTSLTATALLFATQRYTCSLGSAFTGQLTLTFVLSSDAPPNPTTASDLNSYLFIISGSPGASIAALSFEDRSEDLAEAHLSILPEHEPKGVITGHYDASEVVLPIVNFIGYHNIGLDIFHLALLPVLRLLVFQAGLREVFRKGLLFVTHLKSDRDVYWKTWDPWVTWWLYCIWLPGRLISCLYHRIDWRVIEQDLILLR